MCDIPVYIIFNKILLLTRRNYALGDKMECFF